MTRYLLDTNIISELIRPTLSQALIAWMQAQRRSDLFIASMTIAELHKGVREMPPGRRRDTIDAWLAGADGPHALFAGRILAFDEEAAIEWARLMSDGRASGRPRDAIDMIIAATAKRGDCILVTANERHFSGLSYINPLR